MRLPLQHFVPAFAKTLVAAAVLALAAIAPARAQVVDHIDVAAQVGMLSYHGDIYPSESYTLQDLRPAYGGLVRYQFSRFVSARLGYLRGEVRGEDRPIAFDIRRNRLGAFESPVQEISLRFDLDGFGELEAPRNGIMPYLFAGGALTRFDPETDYGLYESAGFAAQWVADDRQNLDAQSAIAVPLGIGLRGATNSGITYGIEAGYRFLLSDYLDGISEAGNFSNNDGYVAPIFHLGYRFYLQDDMDEDGIPDKEDACPAIAGVRYLDGCPDADEDGIGDAEDDCPLEYGPAELGGCPDADEDGVRDLDDVCPEEYGVAELGGCPDFDEDGVADADDACPEEAGLAELAGCPDADGDGIADADDGCPNAAGPADNKGCPLADSDGDGIVDAEDRCPNRAGVAAFGGCPDTDGDGIADSEDQCPDRAGTRAFGGCPDTDGDGIADPDDRCPNSAGVAANGGCPEIKREDRERLSFAVQNVNFETSRATLLPASYRVLDEVLGIMNRYPDHRLNLRGYTDSQGSDATNLTLSSQRAAAVKTYLTSRGVRPDRITARGYGEADPIADNATAEGRALNRRVEFDLVAP